MSTTILARPIAASGIRFSVSVTTGNVRSQRLLEWNFGSCTRTIVYEPSYSSVRRRVTFAGIRDCCTTRRSCFHRKRTNKRSKTARVFTDGHARCPVITLEIIRTRRINYPFTDTRYNTPFTNRQLLVSPNSSGNIRHGREYAVTIRFNRMSERWTNVRTPKKCKRKNSAYSPLTLKGRVRIVV